MFVFEFECKRVVDIIVLLLFKVKKLCVFLIEFEMKVSKFFILRWVWLVCG